MVYMNILFLPSCELLNSSSVYLLRHLALAGIRTLGVTLEIVTD